MLINEIEAKFGNIQNKIEAKTLSKNEPFNHNIQKVALLFESLIDEYSYSLNNECEDLINKLKKSRDEQLTKINEIKDSCGNNFKECTKEIQSFKYVKSEFTPKQWSGETCMKIFLLNRFKFTNQFNSYQLIKYSWLLFNKNSKNNQIFNDALSTGNFF